MKRISLTDSESAAFESGIIQVNGSAMNRTALGIIDAFLKLYPKTTFAELKTAFPDYLNPSAPKQAPKSIFKPYTNRDFGIVHNQHEIETAFAKAGLPYEGLFFTEAHEKFKTADGVTVIVNRLWESNDAVSGASDLEQLANKAKAYGIVINKFEPCTPFTRGSYSLDILEPALFAKISSTNPAKDKKGIPHWIWLLLMASLIAIVFWKSTSSL